MRVHLCGKGFRGWRTGEWRYIQVAGEGATDERSCKIEEGNCCAVVHTNLKPPPHPTKCEKIKRYQIIITSFFKPSFLFFPFHQPPKHFFLFFSLCTNSTFTSFSSYSFFFIYIQHMGKKKEKKKKHPPIYRVNLFYLDFFFFFNFFKYIY